MATAKFKNGDTIQILNGENIPNYTGGWTNAMLRFIGETFVIDDVVNYSENRIGYRVKGTCFIFDERGVHKPDNNQLKIISDGKTVVAKQNEFFGIARCNPEDRFDLFTGINLAIDRMEQQEKRAKEIKVGDQVRIVDTRRIYTTYTDFFQENKLPYDIAVRYCYNGQVPISLLKETFEVKAIGGHRSIANKKIYAIQPIGKIFKPVFLFEEQDIEKI